MNRAPIRTSAMLLLAVSLCWGIPDAMGQCSLCITAGDNTCSGTWDDCETSTTGCEVSSTFTVPCDGNYCLRAWVSCSGNCLTCSACAIVVKAASGEHVEEWQSGCPAEDCDNQTCSVPLEAGVNYRLYVCLRPCTEFRDCDDCDESCRAQATVSSQYGTPCP